MISIPFNIEKSFNTERKINAFMEKTTNSKNKELEEERKEQINNPHMFEKI